VGARAGLLYLATTAGGVLGSLVAGFGLLPRLGVQATVGVAGLCVVAALLCVWRTTRGAGAAPRGRGVLAVAGALAGVAVGAWSLLPDEYLLRRSLPLAPGASGRGVLAVHEGVNETLAVVAQRGPALALMTNGHNMSKTSLSAQRYMDAFVHVPLLLRDDVENVMVMCFGVGNTTAAALRHPGVKRVDVVDLSYDVLAHAEYFDRVNGRPLEDPRVDVYVNDARHHLLMLEGEAYDLVTGEPPPITHAGVVNLYTREFFELVRSRLRPGGLATYWLPLGQVGDGAARSMVRAFLDVFPNAVLLSGYRTHLILVGRKGGRIEIDPAAVARRLASQPALRDDLRPLSLDSPVEIVGMLAATPETLERATRGVAPLRDDDPILEYAVHELQADGRIPADLVSVADLPHWCPRCWNGGLDPDDARRLRGYLEVMARYYASEAFLASRLDVPVLRVAELSEEAKRATEESLYLRDLLSLLSPLHRRALALERHGRPGLAVASLERVVRAHPGDTRAREDLAWLRARVAVPSR
jgi:spermidine synthase